jgi:hypothetical protein
MKSKWLLFFCAGLVALLDSTLNAIAQAQDIWDEMIPVHGQYSKTYMKTDWSRLGTGKNVADKDESDYFWKTVIGQDVHRKYGRGTHVLKNLAYKVNWRGKPRSKRSKLFTFKNCDKVTIENVAIIQNEPYKGSYTFFIKNCKDVYLKNIFISGAVSHRHITINGAENILIDNIEIEGRDYNGNGKYEGSGGIYIHNGDGKRRHANNLKFTVVQNCYIHDFDDVKPRGNFPEGIAIVSPADGIIFNCYVENYKLPGAENAMQITTRRYDKNYGEGHVFRIERCINKRATYNKQGSVWYMPKKYKDNHIIWANNLYYNLNFAMSNKVDYIHHVNETFVMTQTNGPIFRLWNVRAPFYLYNNIFYYGTNKSTERLFLRTTGKDKDDKRALLNADFNLYYMSKPRKIYEDNMDFSNTVKSWIKWQQLGKDKNSVLTNSGSLFYKPDSNADRYILSSDSIARKVGGNKYIKHSHPGLRVSKNFFGSTRSSKYPNLGAF